MPLLRPRFALPLCVLGGLAWTGPAFAAGLSTARFGGEHGTPVSNNPTMVYYNPAGIADSEGIHLFVDGSVAFRSVRYTHERAPSDDIKAPPGANDGEATLFNIAAIPMLGASAKLGDFALGAGFYVPFGGQVSWNKNEAFEDHAEYAGPVDGVQRWFAIESTLQQMYFTIAAAYRIPIIRLSLGASGNLIRSKLDTVVARTATPTGAANKVSIEGRSLLNASGLQGSFGAGALLEAMPKQLWIGASYQSRPNVTGGMKLKGTSRNNFNGVIASDIDVEMHQDLPDIVRFGARIVPSERFAIRLFGDYTRWSSMENQCVSTVGGECATNEDGSGDTSIVLQNLVRRWNDSFGVRAGLSFWPDPKAEFIAGLGYDSSAIPDETLDPGAIDFHSVSSTLGARFELHKQLHLAASYTHVFYVPRDTTGESILAELQSPSKRPDSGGHYSQMIGLVNVNVDVAF